MTEPHPPQQPYPVPPPLPQPVPAPAPPVAATDAHVPQIAYASGSLPAPYASAMPRAKVVIAVSWAMIAVQALMVWPHVEDVRAWRNYAAGVEAAEDAGVLLGMTAPDLAAVLLGLLFLVLAVVSVVFWMMWVHRTYRNLPALGAAGLNYSPGWAVGYYFIPILNLFRPYQVMGETWRASDLRYGGGVEWKTLSAPALIGWWWALHLVSSVVSLASFRVGLRYEDPRTLLAVAWVDLGMLAFDSVLLILEIRLVQALTDLQERRADAVGAVPAGPVAPPQTSQPNRPVM